MAHDDPDDRGRRRAAPHTPETAGLERLRSWACLDADSVPHACPNFSDTVVLALFRAPVVQAFWVRKRGAARCRPSARSHIDASAARTRAAPRRCRRACL